jgi:molecular chaperone GrpE
LSPWKNPHEKADASEAEPERENAEAAAAAAAAGDRGSAQQAEKAALLEAERDELRQMLVRRQADFENFRKRVERERREDRDRAVAHLAESLLPVLDNFERALAAHQDPAYEEYRRGFAMIHRQLSELLAHQGVVRMQNPAGQPFDPRQHHALENVETNDVPEGTVIGEVQAGYRFHDRILRPAQVRVAARAPEHKALPPEVD